MIKTRVLVSGLVQGVFYRTWTQDKAYSLGLSGWVRNLWDGRVEAIFIGDKETVEEMINQLFQGPPASSVEKVEIVKKEKVSTDLFNGRFSIKR